MARIIRSVLSETVGHDAMLSLVSSGTLAEPPSVRRELQPNLLMSYLLLKQIFIPITPLKLLKLWLTSFQLIPAVRSGLFGCSSDPVVLHLAPDCQSVQSIRTHAHRSSQPRTFRTSAALSDEKPVPADVTLHEQIACSGARARTYCVQV